MKIETITDVDITVRFPRAMEYCKAFTDDDEAIINALVKAEQNYYLTVAHKMCPEGSEQRAQQALEDYRANQD